MRICSNECKEVFHDEDCIYGLFSLGELFSYNAKRENDKK